MRRSRTMQIFAALCAESLRVCLICSERNLGLAYLVRDLPEDKHYGLHANMGAANGANATRMITPD